MARGGFFSVDSLEGVHVLVVDDDPIARDVLMSILHYCGALVLTVSSVRKTLEMMRLIKPDVLVVKLALPDQDGSALIRQIRRLKPESGGEVPVIAVGVDETEREPACRTDFRPPSPGRSIPGSSLERSRRSRWSGERDEEGSRSDRWDAPIRCPPTA